ncbi:MAG TPA: cystathionine gamma-synthase [Terriglobia bacterium]|jgi:cystathionine gamma-lyase/cystathionine beta-lyase/cystathionine gamma-lyase/homocysteine desulfhydrase|nr:cystathionine gamma-synthase [Terriglobia bacterium]
MGFSTDAIHVGQEPDPATGAIIVPIYQTSTYVQEELGKNKGYEYARTSNPTRSALERNLACLEGGRYAYAFASGMAAINALMTLMKSGDHVLASHNLYGGSFRLFERVLKDFGLTFSYANTSRLEEVESAIRPNTRVLYVETPTNPVMEITDIAAAAALAHNRGLLLAVDNTFMSPYFQRPLELGADLVLHSTTKYLNGHSDGVGGAIILNDAALAGRLKFLQNAAGAILGPFDSWLVLRGVKTLAVRMRQHDANGQAIAQFLAAHPKVRKVYYPGLATHPQHELARRQMKGFGGMIAFETGSVENAKAVLRTVRLCSLAESLGGVETLISHPATMTHASVPPEDRQRLGITDGLVRISVGIEDVDDLIADLDYSLAQIPQLI